MTAEWLTNDCWMHILKFIDKWDLMYFRQVDKQAKELVDTFVRCGLKELDVSKGITNFFWLLKKCRALKKLEASDLKLNEKLFNADKLSLKTVHNRVLQTIFKSCLNLQHINLGGNYELTDDTIRCIADCKNLQYLDLKSCKEVTDKSICHVIANCLKLKSIFTDGCKLVTENSYKCLAEHSIELRTLAVVDIKVDNEVLRKIAQNCKQLQAVHFEGSDHLTDESVACFAQNCENLKGFHFEYCFEITKNGLSQLTSRHHNLQDLYLNQLHAITDAMFENIADNLKKLKSFWVFVTFGNVITDNGVLPIVFKCVELEDLLISGSDMSDLSLKFMGKKLIKLQTLNISNSKLITDGGIKSLAKCKHLQELDIVDCELVTQKSVTILKKRLLNLEVTEGII